MSLYRTDFHAWAIANAELLKNHKYMEIDLPNLVEELESMGRQERRKLLSHLKLLFLHLLKWQFQPEMNLGSSWGRSIKINRIEVKRQIKENPSLRGWFSELVKEAYELAREDAASETFMSIHYFPEEMPFTLEDALDNDWFPNEKI